MEWLENIIETIQETDPVIIGTVVLGAMTAYLAVSTVGYGERLLSGAIKFSNCFQEFSKHSYKELKEVLENEFPLKKRILMKIPHTKTKIQERPRYDALRVLMGLIEHQALKSYNQQQNKCN